MATYDSAEQLNNIMKELFEELKKEEETAKKRKGIFGKIKGFFE